MRATYRFFLRNRDYISQKDLIVYIVQFIRTTMKKKELHTNPCKKLPAVLVAGGRRRRTEAVHYPDEATSKF